MAVIEIGREVDRFVLHFETDRHQINAFALATSLAGLAEAVREASSIVNPGYSVEVVVEALEEGSFEAVVKTIFEKTQSVFSHEASKAIIYGVIAGYIVTKMIGPADPTIIINEGSVIVEYGDTKVVVPRDVYEAQKQVEKSKRFENAVGQIFRGAESDTTVTAVRIDPPDRGRPGPEVPRAMFSRFDMRIVDENGDRVVVEYANLEISRAILARGKRKWEFFWRGVKISAPVTDDRFYDKFFAHEVKIAPGDVLKAAVRITQRQDKDSGIYMNHNYEVIEVIDHIPRVRQPSL
jgi:hypothetical protein